MAARGELHEIPLDRLQLNLANPRHEEVEGRDEAMLELLQNEQVVELARDIVALGGINPMDRMGVFPIEGTGNGDDQFFATAEGNRRLCALLLLADPDSVPAEMPNRQRYVRTFSALAARIDPISSVPAVVFESIDDARPWLERLHNGGRDGTGRRRWTPEQQARNTNDRTNRAATQLRDLAVELGVVTASGLARTTTTQQRFISNARFRQALGIVRLADGSLERISCWNDFLVMLTKFMEDIVSGEINSRSHNGREQIEAYAESLTEIGGLERRNVSQGALRRRADEDGSREQPVVLEDFDQGSLEIQETKQSDTESLEADTDDDENELVGDVDTAPEVRPNVSPRRRITIGENDEILAALHRLANEKLIDLYRSVCNVRLPQHTLLAVIGCWSFLECMTRAHGREDSKSFEAYINGAVRDLGVDTNPDKGLRRLSLGWIANGGNVTKHDWQGAAYDHRQLCNAMDALGPIVVAMIDDIADQGGKG